ncbi:hypothetical protein AAFC00_005368 [Neodothiora populina]|uniref:BZIP domain-containing protein n=1 Tax=Neodothiora populina TaxID=2781224 RepID=A0ABR3PL07_9PEZI
MAANVAYDGTHADLGMGSRTSFLNSNADLSLFDSDDMFSFTPVNETATAPSTVSPKDVFMESMSSVPSSSAFPELTPGSEMLATPDTSPWFTDNLTTGGDNYSFPLFPDAGNDDFGDLTSFTPSTKRSDSSTLQVVIAEAQETRKASSASMSPMVSALKHTSSAGIRKRQKPLPAIVVDSTDPIALKRARNTAAARKSRERKEAHRDSLESRIAELEALLEQRDAEIATLKAQTSAKDPYGLSELSSLDAFNNTN